MASSSAPVHFAVTFLQQSCSSKPQGLLRSSHVRGPQGQLTSNGQVGFPEQVCILQQLHPVSVDGNDFATSAQDPPIGQAEITHSTWRKEFMGTGESPYKYLPFSENAPPPHPERPLFLTAPPIKVAPLLGARETAFSVAAPQPLDNLPTALGLALFIFRRQLSFV